MNLKLLKTLRKANGLILSDVAEELGISRVTYCNKENGKAPFTVDELKKLSSIFKVSSDELISDDSTINISVK